MFQLALQACYQPPSLTAPFLACSSGVAVLLQETHKNETRGEGFEILTPTREQQQIGKKSKNDGIKLQ
jgi:hypothetical protein